VLARTFFLAVVGAVAAVVVGAIPDIKRYLKIRAM
jgi:hypothetical protein